MIGHSLFRGFFVRVLIGVGLAIPVFISLVHLFQVRVVDQEWREELHQEAVWLARHTRADQAQALAGAWRTMHSSVRVTLFDASGARIADSHPEREPVDIDALREGKEPKGQLAVRADLREGGELAMSRPYVPTFPAGMYRELGLSILFILGPLVLLLYPFARSMAATLRELGRMAEDVAAGNFGKTLPVSRTDELGLVVRAFNDMSTKLAEGERLSSRLLHDVSHELRSPLGRIQVFSDTLVRRPDSRDECLHGIEQEIQLLDRLVGNLLQVTRIEADRQNPRLESFSIVHWASEQLERLGQSVRARGIDWSIHLPVTDWDQVGDPLQLAQAVANLVDNAVHALRDQPDGWIEVSLERTEQRWALTVSDNGPGIPAEHRPHVFRRFYRVDDDRSREHGGVGLGLSLVQAIAAAHGGQVQILDGEGRGTRMQLVLPIDPGRGAQQAGSWIP